MSGGCLGCLNYQQYHSSSSIQDSCSNHQKDLQILGIQLLLLEWKLYHDALIILESLICTMLKELFLWNGHPSIHSNPYFMTNLNWCSFPHQTTTGDRDNPNKLFANAMHLHSLPFSIFVKATPSPVSLKESIWMPAHILDLPTAQYHWKVQVWVRILGVTSQHCQGLPKVEPPAPSHL